MNKITKEHPKFEELTGDYDTAVNKEPRRGSNFFCNLLFVIDEGSEFDGTWMSNRLVGDHDHGTPVDWDELVEIVRAEKQEVVAFKWQPIESDKLDG